MNRIGLAILITGSSLFWPLSSAQGEDSPFSVRTRKEIESEDYERTALYFPGEKISFLIEGSITDGEEPADLFYEIADAWGKEIVPEKKIFSLDSPGHFNKEFTLLANECGFYQANFFLKKVKIRQEEKLYYAVIPRVESGFKEDSLFGVQHYSGKNNFAFWQKLGIKWCRLTIRWDMIEEQDGVFKWDYYDKIIGDARKQHIKIEGLFHYGWKRGAPLSARMDGTNYNLKLDRWARFVSEVVKRYKDEITYWEVINEPNGGKYKFDYFLKMLKITSEAAKKMQPQAKIILDTGGIAEGYYRRVIERGYGNYFDVAAPHTYTFPSSPEEFHLGEKLESLKKVLERAGGKELWTDEVGYPVGGKGAHNTRMEQASYMIRLFMIARSVGIKKVFFFHGGPGLEAPDKKYATGSYRYHGMLAEPNYGVRPIVPAYRTISAFLEDSSYTGKLFPDDYIPKATRVYVFKGQKRTVAVLWRTKKTIALSVKIEDPTIQLFNIFGTELPIKRKKALIEVPLTNEPHYLLSKCSPQELLRAFAESKLAPVSGEKAEFPLQTQLKPVEQDLEKSPYLIIQVKNISAKPLGFSVRLSPPEGWRLKKEQMSVKALLPGESREFKFHLATCHNL